MKHIWFDNKKVYISDTFLFKLDPCILDLIPIKDKQEYINGKIVPIQSVDDYLSSE